MAVIHFGSCLNPTDFPALAAAGGDYAELAVARDVMGDDATFACLQSQLADTPLRAPAYNLFLPADLRIVGPAIDRQRQEAYVNTALARLRQLSGDAPLILVVGSGRARQIPDNFSRPAALDQLATFFGWVGPRAADHGIRLALEHLRHAESNVFNSLAECGDFIRAHTLPNVHLVADLYHLQETGEPLTAIATYAELIIHTHVADSGRRPPGTGSYPLVEFFAQLHQIGYQGCCSIECSWTNFATEITPAIAALRIADRASQVDA